VTQLFKNLIFKLKTFGLPDESLIKLIPPEEYLERYFNKRTSANLRKLIIREISKSTKTFNEWVLFYNQIRRDGELSNIGLQKIIDYASSPIDWAIAWHTWTYFSGHWTVGNTNIKKKLIDGINNCNTVFDKWLEAFNDVLDADYEYRATHKTELLNLILEKMANKMTDLDQAIIVYRLSKENPSTELRAFNIMGYHAETFGDWLNIYHITYARRAVEKMIQHAKIFDEWLIVYNIVKSWDPPHEQYPDELTKTRKADNQKFKDAILENMANCAETRDHWFIIYNQTYSSSAIGRRAKEHMA
jgi:hypothetical protein